MLKTNTIDAVRHLSIVDVIGRNIDLKKKGANYLAISPFTDEKTPSFTVFPRKNNFKCFSSGKQGDGIAFVMEYKKLEFHEAIREIAQDHGIPIEEEDLTPEQKEKLQKEYDQHKEILKVMEYSKNHFLNNPIPIEWIKDRKYNEDLLTKFQVGYDSGNTTLIDDAIKAGFSRDQFKKAGLIRNVFDHSSDPGGEKVWLQVDSYADRVIFPIHDIKGNTVAFTARYNGKDEKAPKYINSPGEVWKKSLHLYGLYQAEKAIRKNDKVYLVEGPTDVLRMSLWGLENTICPCGSTLTNEQCKLLYRYTDRITIVPDNDLEKEDNPGMKAMEKNAKLLLEHGFFVSVLIPGSINSEKSEDPDSFIGKMRTNEQFGKWIENEEGYVEDYLTRVCIAMSEISAEQKYQAVKAMAETLESVKETSYRNALYDSIGKLWSYFKKEYKLVKREARSIVSTDVEMLKRELRDEYFTNKFIEENGKYITWVRGGDKKELSNFTFKVIFTVTFIIGKEQFRKAVLSLTSEFNYRKLAVINSDDFCSSITFKKVLRRRGEFYWQGKDENLDDVSKKVFLNAPNAIELDRMGWNGRHNFWVWSNGIYYDGSFHPMDKYGLIQRDIPIKSMEQFSKLRNGSQLIIEGKLVRINNSEECMAELGENELQRLMDGNQINKVDFFYLPFGTALQIDTSEDDKGIDFKKDIQLAIPAKDDEWTFNQWASKMNEVYGTNGWIMIAYYMASIFRDIIFTHNHGWFPLLYFFGMPKSGKSSAAKSVYQMFGAPPQNDGINLSSGSTPVAMGRYMNSITNIPGLFNEFKNHVSERVKEVMKGWADGSGRIQDTRSAKDTEAIMPKSGALICGQELPSSEAALMSRIVPLEFDKNNRPTKKIYDVFKDIEKTGILTWITCKILDYRPIFKNYGQVESLVYDSIREKCLKTDMKSDDRLLLNACSLLTPIKLFIDYTDLEFPFTYEQFEANMIKVMEMSNQIQAESDEGEKFFTILMSVVGNPHTGIIEGQDFMIKNTGSKKLLFLRYMHCYGKYAARARVEGINPMDKIVLTKYLQKHPSFIDLTKKAKFGKTETSAHIFDYDMLLEKDINLEKTGQVSDEDKRHYEDKKFSIFEEMIYNLEVEKQYQTKELIKELSSRIDDYISQFEFVHMCNNLNDKKNGIQVHIHNEDLSVIHVESSNGLQKGLPF